MPLRKLLVASFALAFSATLACAQNDNAGAGAADNKPASMKRAG